MNFHAEIMVVTRPTHPSVKNVVGVDITDPLSSLIRLFDIDLLWNINHFDYKQCKAIMIIILFDTDVQFWSLYITII